MTKVLLTGASGFLGTYIVKELLKRNAEVFAFSRSARTSKDPNLKWLVADLSNETSYDVHALAAALEGVDLVIHAAALYDMNSGHVEHFRQNVIGTSNLMHIVRQIKGQPHFAHISTVGIAGNASVNFDESMFDVGQTFSDPYSSTKFASEYIVRNANDLGSRSVYRLGVVVGSTTDGKIDRIDGPYYLQDVIRRAAPFVGRLGRMRFFPFPYGESTRLYLIPVDIAANVIVELAFKVKTRSGIETFHVTGGGRGVSVRKLIQMILAYYDIPLSPMSVPRFLLPAALFRMVGTPPETVPYIHTKWTFSSKNVERELPGLRYPSFTYLAKKLMNYAEQHFFSKGDKS